MTEASINPYVAPTTDSYIDTPNINYCVKENFLVIRRGAYLPKICIKTSEQIPDQPQKKKNIYWIHPGCYFFIVLGPVALFIVYFLARKKVTFYYSLSKSAKKKMRPFYWMSYLLISIGIIAMISFSDKHLSDIEIYILPSITSIVIGLIIHNIISNPFRVKRHSKDTFKITGFNKKFLTAVSALSPQETEHTS